MTWNHRVVRFKDMFDPDRHTYEFKEVFYTEDGAIMGYTDVHLLSDTLDGAQELANRLLEATAKPVLNVNDLGDLEEP